MTGSSDNTKDIVNGFMEEGQLEISYFFQENCGKMKALNALLEHVTGELMVECDSDDYFTNIAMKHIADNCSLEEDIYATAFLKYDQNNCNIGNLFKTEEGYVTTMFDLYFKDEEPGEKALVFQTKLRKEYKYVLEKDEKFSTESRLFHQMDLKYKIKGFNNPIMVCEYLEDGYTKNIKEMFLKYPYGYYQYFKEIFEHDMKDVTWKKRLYAIKHYILFSYITSTKKILKNIKGNSNKLLVGVLYIPGMLASKAKGYKKV